jgi:O-antigen/teichoic acid export membrane protein
MVAGHRLTAAERELSKHIHRPPSSRIVMGDDLDSVFRSVFKSGAIVFLGFVLEMSVSFLGKIIAARWLARADYGAVAIGTTLLSSLTVITLLGLNTGVSRQFSRYDDDASRRGVIVSAFQIVLPLAVVVSTTTYILAGPIARRVFDDPSLIPVLHVFAIALPFLAVTKLSLGTIRGAQRTLPKVYIQNIGTPILRLGLVVAAVLLGAQVVGIAWAYALARIIPALAGVYFLYRLTPLFGGRSYVPMRRKLLVFSLPLVVSAAMGRVLADFDTYLLGYYTDLGLVGTYNVIYPIVTATGFVLSAFGYLTLPVISRLHEDERRQEMAILYKGVSKWVFLITLPLLVALVLFPEFVISATFGNKYLGGATALQVLVLSYVVGSFTGPNIQILTAIGQTRMLMAFNVAAATINVVLNMVLIPRYQLVGAAAATFVSLVLLELFVSARLYRQTELHPFSRALVLPAAFGVALAGGLYAAVVALVGVSGASVVGLFAVFLPLYAGGIIRLGGVEEQEVMIVENVEHRFGVDLEPIKRIARRLM